MTMEHLNRSFAVSLHIRHPAIDPAEVTQRLRLVPARERPAGPPRKPPYDQACWSHAFDCQNVRELTPFLEQTAGLLAEHSGYLNELRNTGGSIELFCGIAVDFNWDKILPAALMRRLAALGIDLRLDAYPQDSTHRRIVFRDLMELKKQMDSERLKALDQLAQQAQELDMGY